VGNLLDNARVHAPGAPVRVALARSPGVVMVTVADRGPGASPTDADLERLFERFAKADPARPGGSGLGLAIAREHAELLGGSLRVAVEPDRGLRFELRLPVTESLPAGDAMVMRGRDGEPRSKPTGSPPR
jgi:two-component system sensor histidine kinase MtrB